MLFVALNTTYKRQRQGEGIPSRETQVKSNNGQVGITITRGIIGILEKWRVATRAMMGGEQPRAMNSIGQGVATNENQPHASERSHGQTRVGATTCKQK